jgi:hypothetical protein
MISTIQYLAQKMAAEQRKLSPEIKAEQEKGQLHQGTLSLDVLKSWLVSNLLEHAGHCCPPKMACAHSIFDKIFF